MAAVVDLNKKRELDGLRKARDNSAVTPRQLVDLIADDLDKEDPANKPVRMIALIEVDEPNGRRTLLSFRSNCTRAEEIAILEVHKAAQVEDWRNS